jgi:hypothetical protein
MAKIYVRQAQMDDTQPISLLFRSRVERWQRLNPQGQVEDLPYPALTIYERWLHGSQNDSAWMNVETGAIWLSHLLRGGGIPVVAVAQDDESLDSTVLAYAEAYHSTEPDPFGDHLHLAQLITHPDHSDLKALLIQHLLEQIQVMQDCHRLTVSLAEYDAESKAFYQGMGMKPLARARRFVLPAKTGQGFYKAVDNPTVDSAQVEGWWMSVGRSESARQHWEMLWPRLWDAIPEIASRPTYRLRFSASGQDAYIICQQQLYNPRSAEIFCWSPKPLTSQLLIAIRDWTHRQGYRDLVFTVTEDAVKTLGTEAEPQPYDREIFAVDA